MGGSVVEIARNNNIQSRAKNKWLTSSRVNRCVAAGSSTSSEDCCLQPIARVILPVLQQSLKHGQMDGSAW